MNTARSGGTERAAEDGFPDKEDRASSTRARPPATRRPLLDEPVIVAEWWKNRGGNSIRISLQSYKGRNLVDLRTWFGGDDGRLKPGKGFSAVIAHLPRMVAELEKALAKARELGLIDDDEAQQ